MEIKKITIPNLGTTEIVENLYPVFAPDGSPANTIEGLKLKGFNYPIMVQKGLHSIGDLICYIRWDTCLPELDIFKSFIAPNRNPKKSILAVNNRVRVVKLAGNFSYGIVLPIKEVEDFLEITLTKTKVDLTEILGLHKIEVVNDNFLIKGGIPNFMYKTGEINIWDINGYGFEIKDVINQLYKEGVEIQFTEKRDGSSESLYVNGKNTGICSRTSEIKSIYTLDDIPFDLRIEMVRHKIGHTKLTNDLILKNATKEEIYTFFNDKGKWNKRGEENRFKTENEFNIYHQIISKRAEYVKLAILDFKLKLKLEPCIQAEIDHQYLPKFVDYCKRNGKNYILRGETLGYSKGSNNSKNPDKLNKKVVWFGLDEIDPIATRVPTNAEVNLYTVCEELNFEATPIIKRGTFSFDEVVEFADKYFKTHMIEGLVIRTTSNNKLSCKIMNSRYDFK